MCRYHILKTDFYNPDEPLDYELRGLPHWYQPGKLQFITFRLADSLPEEVLKELDVKRRWIEIRDTTLALSNQPSAGYISIVRSLEKYMDKGYGDCLLTQATCRKLVENRLREMDGQAYDLLAYVIMPNHVHLLLRARQAPKDFIPLLKQQSATDINLHMNRQGRVWQKHFFDRMPRSENGFLHQLQYIIRNPKGLPADSYTLFISPHLRLGYDQHHPLDLPIPTSRKS